MGKLFRLHRTSLRTKIAYFSALGLAVTAVVMSLNVGTTLSADPTFIPPVTVAGGNTLYYDMNLRIRPTDGAAFVVGNKASYVGLSVTNPASPGSPLGFQNIVPNDGSGSFKFPAIAFSSNGTGYAVWRTVNDGRGRGFEGYIRIIPNNYMLNGNNNTTLGNGFYLTDRIPGDIKFDQPTVGVLNNGNVVVVGYYANNPTQLAMATFDANLNYLSFQVIGNQPGTNRSEMDPQMCVDGANNIHIITLDPANPSHLAIYSRVGGGGFVGTDITAPGYDNRDGIGRAGKDIVCAPSNDGKAYAVTKRLGAMDFYSRPAGVGQTWGIGGQPNLTDVFGYEHLNSVAVTISLDGRVYVAQGDGDNGSARPGTYVKYSDNGGSSFLPGPNKTNAIAVVPKPTYSNVSVAMDGNGPGSKVHLTASFTGQQPESTFYSYANTVLSPPTGLVATSIDSKQINLSWTASASTPDSYKIYRSLPNQNSGFTQIGTSATTTYQDNNLPYGTTYYYKVTAVKGGFSDSADSNVASSTTLGPASIKFNADPSNGQAGLTTYQPTITVLDQAGQTVTNYNGTVTFSISPGTGETGVTTFGAGTVNQAITNGVSSFVNTPLRIDNLGNVYKFRATITALGIFGDSAPFNLTGQLQIALAPGTTIRATEPFSVVVTIKNFSTNDPNTANKDSLYNGQVFFDLTTNPNSAYYFGQTSKVASSGVVTFTNLMIDKVDVGYGFTGTLPSNLGTGTLSSVPVVAYSIPGDPTNCTRILVSPDGDICSNPDLQLALTTALGKPVYIDHRAGPTGNGTGQYTPGNVPLIVPANAWLDAGCRGAGNTPWGMQFTVSGANTLSITGGSFIRGLEIVGSKAGSAVLSVTTGGNAMSCTRVAYSPAG